MKDLKVYIDLDEPYKFIKSGLGKDAIRLEIEIGGSDSQSRLLPDGRATLVLHNEDKKYTPNNPNSEFYQRLIPNRRVYFEYRGYVVWTGILHRIENDLRSTERTSKIKFRQGMELLKEGGFNWDSLQNVTAGEVLTEIFEQNQLLPANPDFTFILDYDLLGTELTSPVSDYMHINDDPYEFTYVTDAWDDNTTAFEAVRDITEAVQGYSFLNRKAEFTFLDYYYAIDEDPVLSIDIDKEGQDASASYHNDIINELRVKYYEKELQENALFWEIEEPIGLSEGEDREITISHNAREDEIPFTVLERPNVVNVTPLTAGVSIEITNSKANKTTVVLTNNTGGQIEVSFGLQADIVRSYRPRIVEKRNQPSIDLYREIYSETMDNKIVDTDRLATQIATYRLLEDATGYTQIETVTFKRTDDSILSTLEVGDVVSITSNENFYDDQYLITGERHIIENKLITSTYNVKTASAVNIFNLGVNELGGEALLG